MPVVGRGDGDGVDFFQCENLAEVFLRDRRLAHLLLGALCELSENVTVHVAHVRDACRIAIGLERCEMCIAASIQTDDREVQAIIGTEDPAVAPGGECDRQANRAGCQGSKKITPRSHYLFCKLPVFGKLLAASIYRCTILLPRAGDSSFCK